MAHGTQSLSIHASSQPKRRTARHTESLTQAAGCWRCWSDEAGSAVAATETEERGRDHQPGSEFKLQEKRIALSVYLFNKPSKLICLSGSSNPSPPSDTSQCRSPNSKLIQPPNSASSAHRLVCHYPATCLTASLNNSWPPSRSIEMMLSMSIEEREKVTQQKSSSPPKQIQQHDQDNLHLQPAATLAHPTNITTGKQPHSPQHPSHSPLSWLPSTIAISINNPSNLDRLCLD